MLGLEEGKGKIGEGHKKILVVCKESFKEKVFFVEKYPCGKVHILRETIFVDSILREKYPCGKKKSFLGGKRD